MGVGGCEIKTIGYTCRSVVLKVFGPGFNSRRLHQTNPPLGRLTEGLVVFRRSILTAQQSQSRGVASPFPLYSYHHSSQHQDNYQGGVRRGDSFWSGMRSVIGAAYASVETSTHGSSDDIRP